MNEFPNDCGFEVTTSSPRYAQSNNRSEKCVGIVKSFLRKAYEEGTDPYISLLQYREKNVAGAPYSPAQMLMSRPLRDKLPSTTLCVEPKR